MSDNENPRATGEAVEINGQRFTGGTGAEIIDALLHGLRVNGVEKLPGKGWQVRSRGDTKTFGVLADALAFRLGDIPAPRGRVVTEAEVAGMKADADAGWEHVELFRDALAHANKIANEHSAVEDGSLTVVRFSTPTWLAFLQSMGKSLALADADAGGDDA